MNKIIITTFILLLSILLIGCSNMDNISEVQAVVKKQTADSTENAEKKVLEIVEKFGRSLQKVSLLAPREILKKSMQENYSQYVSPELIEKWVNDPLKALGRLTSSPWPDRIEVKSTKKVTDVEYEVFGEVIEVTNDISMVSSTPIQLTVEKYDERWLITNVTFVESESNDSIVYKNDEYHFTFKLPSTWNGFSIINDEWKGTSGLNEKVIERGPIISIRHPEWTTAHTRQDIPILIFTLEQWEALHQEKFHIGAAPIEPKELARNEQYVFALPARYNFAFPTGYEEVEQILESNPLEVNTVDK